MKKINTKIMRNAFVQGITMVMLICLLTGSVYAQESRITGQVLDETGAGLPGATIMEVGTSNGTTSDLDGNFSLTVANQSSQISISFIGYQTQTLLVGSNSEFTVKMDVDAQNLEEVVVVGYGTQNKKTATGSVSQVSGSDVIMGKATSSAALSLQGEVPGVNITRTSSRPGQEGLDIKIRGDISVNGVSPLILLDGLVITEWELSTINPNDIESISVLKDAAAAIYGTRAAGGVILVTSKKGVQGKVKVEYNGQFQMNIPNDFPLANLQEWAGLWLEAGDNDGITYVDANGNEQTAASNYRFFSREELEMIVDGTMPFAPEPYYWLGQERFLKDDNQYDAVYGKTWSQRHNLSFSGGSDKVSYRSSFGYNKERSPIEFVYDGAERFNFRTNLSYQMSELLSTDLSISYDNRLIDSPTQGVGHGVQDMYIFPLYNPLGQYYDTFGSNNLLAKLDEGGRTTDNAEILRLGGGLNLDLDKYVKGLSFNYNFNIGIRDSERKERTTSVTMYDWVGEVSYTPTTLMNSYYRLFYSKSTTQMHSVQGNYKHSIGKNNLELTLGATSQLDAWERNYFGRSNMATDELNHINLGDVSTNEIGGSVTTNQGSRFNTGAEEDALLSYLGRFNYNYDGIYLLEVLVRRDGSSRLHPDYRWKNFYGVSAGVRISDMSFMPTGIFDDLKLRASYGEVGSQAGISRYDYLSNMSTGTTIFGVSPALNNTASISGITSIDRTWERVSTTNFALDFAVLNQKLSGTAEYFIRKNDGMLTNIVYPQVLGGTAPLTNSGAFETKGWELSLNWKDQVGDLKYNVSLMSWNNESEVTRFDGAQQIVLGVNGDDSGENHIEGKPLNAIYAYKTDGILRTEDEVLEYYNQYGFEDTEDHNVLKSGTNLPAYNSPNRLTTGNVRRVDANGDGVINQDDLVYIGDANPHYNVGLRLGLQWKGLDFNMFMQGVGQQNIVREGGLAYPFSRWWMNQNSQYLGNTWNEENQDAIFPKSFYNGHRQTWNYNLNDINVVKASYLRAKLISVGYSLPENIISKAGLGKVRFSLTGTDLFVISNVQDGMDPEMKSSAHQGDAIPYMSTFIFGLDILF